ncbi:MAG: hypothetical protein COA79_11185 [Planctomycetota bacterium]|nr:MAG: hypothetical protein COA79_11185 [Planctomycetota bacterium]
MTESIVSRNIAPLFKTKCSMPAKKLGNTLIEEKSAEFLSLENENYKFNVQDYYGEQVSVLLNVSASKKGEIENVKVYCDCIKEQKEGNPDKVCSHLWAALNYFDINDLLDAEFKEMNSSLHRFLKDLADKAKLKDKFAPEEEEAPSDPYPFYIVEVDASLKYLCLSLIEKVLKKNGEWGKEKPLQDVDLRIAKIPYQEDIDALQMIMTSSIQNNLKGFNYKHIYQQKVISVLDTIEKTGRALYILKGDDGPKPLNIEFKNPWRLCMNFSKTEDVFTLNITVKRDQEVIPMNEIVAFFGTDEISFFHKGSFYKFVKGTELHWVDACLKNNQSHFDKEAFVYLMQEIQQYAFTPTYHFNDDVGVKQFEIKSITPILRIQFDQFISGRLSFEYLDGVEFSEFDTTTDYFDNARFLHLKRSDVLENESRFVLDKLDFNYKGGVWLAPAVDLLDKVNELIEKGWKILANQDKPIQSYNKFKLNVSTGIDWLSLKAELTFGDQTFFLPDIVKAYQKNANFIMLDDGTCGMLPNKWLTSNFKALDFGELVEKESRIQFSKAHALMLEEIINQIEGSEKDDLFMDICKSLKDFSGVEKVPVPKTFKGELRPYQVDGFRWMNFLNSFKLGGCLADDMGLGKTIQMITMLLWEKDKKQKHLPSMIVVPTSIIFNWCNELDKFGPSLTYMSYTGSNRKELWDQFAETDVILTTYGIVRRDCIELAKVGFNYLILDEAQAIKNSVSQTAKAVKIIESNNKLSMTGTPIENHIGELWSQFDFLLPGFLGNKDRFMKNYHKKSIDDPNIDMRPLKALISPFMMRRTKDEVVKDLPAKVEQVIYCEMKEYQKTKYNEVFGFFRSKLMSKDDSIKKGKSSIQILEALMALRQICCHPELYLKSGLTEDIDRQESAKLETLMSMLEEIVAEDHKALVFSQFTSMLAIMRVWLDKSNIPYCYLDGSTPIKKRQEQVEKFQADSSIKVFLISLKAGGVGLNLTAADYVFIYDPWWNPAVEAQAVDRTHRIGQTKKIFTYRLITKDSIEEKVHHLQKTKRELAKNVIDDGTIPTSLTKNDLQSLFLY